MIQMSTQYLTELERLYNVYKDKPRNEPATITFMDWVFEVPDPIGFLYQAKEIMAHGIYDFPCSIPNPVILDCGANVGVSAVHLATRHPDAQMLLFEADPAITGYLERNLSRNGLGHIPVIQGAVWVHGEGMEFTPEGSEGGSILGVGPSIRVNSLRLRDVLTGLERVDFLKMDIEGAEADVLADCADLLPRVGFAFVECHCWRHRPQTLHQVLAVLAQAGFRYYLENIWPGDSPFIRGGGGPAMDVQANVWARRKFTSE
ncbi:MAG: FkbM family methyltransferase [Desulfovibrio sp.]|nr:FkbM family methyltransferase [Desulfovibrio sp.]MBI4961154.1 FkbM family methyltransferase [Desulfovibrio sp.]